MHDIGKALDHEIEGSHVQIGVDIARKYRENPAVVHAIEAHHGDVEPKTPLAFLVQAADAISAARPGARRENLESYIKRLEEIGDDQLTLLARSITKKIEEELDYPGQIKVNVIRESRAVEYAK